MTSGEAATILGEYIGTLSSLVSRLSSLATDAMTRSVRLLAALSTLLVVSASAQSTIKATLPGCPALPALDSVQIMRDVFRLADDSMRGRKIGTPENAKARDFLAARFDALGLSPLNGVRIQKWANAPRRAGNDSLRGANVIGMIKGSTRPEQYIVVSAHFDHIGVGSPVKGDSINNGADDNASGTVALLAAAKYFMKAKPAHTIIFALFDGEESGDQGSKAWVDAAPVSLDKILLDANMDMLGRNIHNELYAAGPTKYPQLRPLVEESIRCAPREVILKVGHDTGGRGYDWTDQSDQGAFNAKGIPFVYFGEEDHPDYHRPSDSADKLMPAFLVTSARIVVDFVRRFDAAPVARH